MNDTRKDGRLTVSLVARYREPSMLDLREGECQDLSLNGMFIQTPKPSPRGALIRFECDAGRPENNFRGTGRVVWQRRKADSRGPAGMGVRFVRLESGDHDALERIIAQLNAAANAGGGAAAAGPSGAAAKLAATLRGQPPVADPRSGPSDRPDGPSSRPAEPTRHEGAPTSARPPMPTLLEVPRTMPSGRPAHGVGSGTLPDGGGSNRPQAADNSRTLLGVAAPVSPGGRHDGDAPGAGSGHAQPHPPTGHSRNATVLESAVKPGDIADRVSQGDARGGRGGKKKNRGRRSTPGATPSNGARAAHAGPSGAPRHDDRAGSRHEPPLEVSEPYAPEYGGRRRRLDTEEGEARRTGQHRTRASSGTVMWLVLGTGLVVSWGLVTLFGTVPVGVPDKPPAEAHDKSTAAVGGAGAEEPTAASREPEIARPTVARRYALFVETRPPGSRISVGGQSVVSPARVELDTIQPPLIVNAELPGYQTKTVNIWPSDFAPKGPYFEYKLVIEMQQAPAAPAPVATPAPARTTPAAAATPTPRAPATAATPPAPPKPKPETPKPAEPSGVAAAPEPASSPEPAPAAEAAPPSGGSRQTGALAQALECLGRGDNRCVIRVLEGRASTAREIDLLIETYRAMGSTPKAEREMMRYIETFPNGKRTAEYRRLLERRGAKVQ